MADFTIPEVGEGIDKGTVVAVLVKVGDKVALESPLLEFGTDKATVEIPSTLSGIVEKILIKEGDEVKVGQVAMVIASQTASTSASAQQPPASNPAPQAPSSTEEAVTLPEVGEGITSGTVVGILVKVGDKVVADQGLLELGTDKATVEIPSPKEGIVSSILVSEGQEAKIGQTIMTLSVKGTAVTSSPPLSQVAAQVADVVSSPKVEVAKAAPVSVGASVSNRSLPAAPSVRRVAREMGIDLKQISGSGILGRISLEDVQRFAKGEVKPPAPTPVGSGRPMVKLPDFGRWGAIERSAMSGIRKATARQMDLAWSNIPMVTHHDKVDITNLEVLRKNYAKKVETAGGGKLTPTAIIAKVVATALSMPQFKDFNASVDMESQEVIHKHYVHIGIAVDTPKGLIVPVIRDVNKKNLVEISKDLNDLAERGRAGKVKPDEMQGGTFSISNLGGIGGYAFTPIVNHPEVAILGVCRAGLEPRFKEDGTFEPRLMMGLSLSYDHRLIDGALAARFVRWVGEALEEPFVMMIGA